MSLEDERMEEMYCMSKEDQRQWARDNFWWPPTQVIHPKWPSEVQNECLKMIKEINRCSCGRGDRRVQYSYGTYAGKMCDHCAYENYKDGCGHTIDYLNEKGGKQGDQNELRMMGETIEAEDY